MRLAGIRHQQQLQPHHCPHPAPTVLETLGRTFFSRVGSPLRKFGQLFRFTFRRLDCLMSRRVTEFEGRDLFSPSLYIVEIIADFCPIER